MISRKFIGYTTPPASVEVEKGQLRFFAKATGQQDPVYSDEGAARAAGHRGLPVPPTFFICLESAAIDSTVLLDLLGIDRGKLLHGEQGFAFHAQAYSGDTLTFEQRIEDIYEKRSGALEFVARKTRVTNQRGEHVADLRCLLVVRHG